MYTSLHMVNHMRHTRSQTGNRRSHHALTAPSLTLCESCGSPTMRHKACINCGKYKKREVMSVYKELTKKGKAPKVEKTENKAPKKANKEKVLEAAK